MIAPEELRLSCCTTRLEERRSEGKRHARSVRFNDQVIGEVADPHHER